MEISDRPINPEDITHCPDDCDAFGMHRRLKDGTVQHAYQGFGVTDQGDVVHGPPIVGDLGDSNTRRQWSYGDIRAIVRQEIDAHDEREGR
jgi:hypothetical protein